MIVPIRKEMLPWRNAARSRIGVPIIAPRNPIPWLILFASSSPADCVHLGKANDLSTTFIALPHATCAERFCQAKMISWYSTLNVGRLVSHDQSDLFRCSWNTVLSDSNGRPPLRAGGQRSGSYARRTLKFRWTFAIHSSAPRYLKVFYAHFPLQRNWSRQT